MRTDVIRSARSRLVRVLALVGVVSLAASACVSDAESEEEPEQAETEEVGEPQHGGEITVILDAGFDGNWPTGLDPATSDTTGSNLAQNSAVFGGLFTLENDENGEAHIVPDQAESYEWSDDGLTLTVKIRDGIEFSDGTPFDAEAVLWNWIRALSSGATGSPQISLDLEREQPELSEEFLDSLFAALPEDVDRDAVMERLGAIQVVDDLTVEMHFDQPDGSFVNGLPVSMMNLIASPTAYAELGAEAFKTTPVGAGPFVITGNQQNERLEVERNENYFKDDLPYLDAITFQSVSGDQVAYQTLQANQGDVVSLSDTALLREAESNPEFTLYHTPPTSPYVVQLNTRTAPFDDKRAREAIYHATDWEAINRGLFGGAAELTESFTASGGLFYHPEVPGYRQYDPERAAELVDEIGGLQVTLGTTDLTTARQVSTALQTQWQEAGIDVDIHAAALGDVITEFLGGEWQAMLQTAGAWDPAVGLGVGVRFGSTSPFSGTPLPEGAASAADALAEGLQSELDEMLEAAVLTVDPQEREELYRQISQHISDEAYAPFGVAAPGATVARNGIYGPGLSEPIAGLAVRSQVLYDRVWTEQ